MPRRPEGERALTPAERQARIRVRKAAAETEMRLALERIAASKTFGEARQIAQAALGSSEAAA
jgi:hypothetical protein